jgi:hypothetical protein
MNRIRIAVILLLSGAAFSSRAVGPLLFTNITSSLGVSSSQTLNAVAYDGNATFVSVGTNSATLAGTFVANGSPWFPNNKWAISSVSNQNLKLSAVTFGGGNFVASGSNNLIFVSPEGTNWTPNGSIFPNTVEAAGLAYNANDGRFVAVGQAPEISWSDSPLSWHSATLKNANVSFLESFRGVTPFTAGGFASCGIFGEVRSSMDGGVTWQTNRGKSGLAELRGIAADDSQTLVSVGVGGATIVSTDGGTTWATPSVYSADLNAVAYGGSSYGFIAVGAGGAIITSSNNFASWQTNIPTARNLLGIAFGRSGLLRGVGVIVGEGGTVVLAGTAPPPPILPINQTNFSLSLPNPPLSVTISNDLDHPASTVAIDWYNSSGVLVASSSSSYVPTDTLPTDDNTPANYTYHAVSRDLRTGFTNSTSLAVTLSIVPRPKSHIISTLVRTNCNDGSSFTITNVLTGIGPWVIQWSTGAMQTNLGGVGPVINTFTLFPTNTLLNSPTGYTFSVTSLTTSLVNNGVPVSGSALPADLTDTNELIVNPRPTAAITSLDRTNCNDGSAYVIQADLTGISPWTVMWSDGAISNYIAPLAVRTVFPTNTLLNLPTSYTFWIGGLIDANCTAEPQDIKGTNTVTVNPRPTSTLTSLDRTNCNDGSAYVIQAALTGISPWKVTWSDGAVSNYVASPGVRTVFPTNVLLNASTNFSFWIGNLTDTNCTAGPQDLIGTNIVTINPRPTSKLTSLDQTNCNDGSPYVIQAALTGISPWQVTWSDGAISNYVASPAVRTVFPTNVLPNLPTNYSFWVGNLTDRNCTAGLHDLTGTNTVTINPLPPAPVSVGIVTNCAGITNPPLLVTVVANATADWYDSTKTILLATNTLSYIPPIAAAGMYTNYAQARYTNLTTQCVSATMTPVVLVEQDCTNAISSITLDNGTNAVIQWYGNFVLQSATNITPPASWTNLVQGGVGITNFWTNSVVPPPPANFFRLYAPTN